MSEDYVYIMANKLNGSLFIGITNNLKRHIQEHKHGNTDGFIDLWEKIEAMEKKYDKRFAVVFEAIRQLMGPPQKTKGPIGFRQKQ